MTKEIPKYSSQEELADWLSELLAEEAGREIDTIDPDKPFAGYGIGSVQAVAMTGELEELFNTELEPTIFFEYPTINKLAAFLWIEVLHENHA